MGDGGEVLAVLRLHAQHHGIGGQRFAIALGHVFGQLVHHAAEHQQALAAIGQRAVGMAAVGAGGHAEGVVAGSAVGGRRDHVGGHAALAFEEHVAPAAAGAAGSVGESVEGGGGEQGTEQNPFHRLFSLEVDRSHLERASDAVSFSECHRGVKAPNGWQRAMPGEN